MADILDILTEDEALDAINMRQDNSDHLAEVAQQVTAVSRMIDAACGPVVQRTVTAEIHEGGVPVVFLQAPVVSVSLVRYASGGTITTYDPVEFGDTGDGYGIDLPSGRLYRRFGSSTGAWSAGQVEATYVAGRFATTETVDARFKTCAASVLRRLWKREAGTWAQSADFYESLDVQTSSLSGFFRVAKPIIDEMLWDELVLPGIA